MVDKNILEFRVLLLFIGFRKREEHKLYVEEIIISGFWPLLHFSPQIMDENIYDYPYI